MNASKLRQSEIQLCFEYNPKELKQEDIDESVHVNSNHLYRQGEFWTSKQRQANRIHEISYRACFKPQLPRYFIKRYTNKGNIVYDPFMGRGTTPVEAALLERVPYGNDLSPVSMAFTEPRLNTPELGEISKRLSKISWRKEGDIENEELLAFYHPKTLRMLEGLRSYFLQQSSTELDRIDLWIRMVALNRLTGHSPGFFSVYTMPPNQAVTVKRQRIINARRQQSPEEKNIPGLIWKKSKSLLSHGGVRAKRNLLLQNSADSTPQIGECEVDLVVTSPPFVNVVDYRTDNWLRHWFISDKEYPEMSIHSNVKDWQAFIGNVLKELCRVLKVGGFIAFEVGEVRKGTVRLEENVIAASSELPLSVDSVLINQQSFTKTSNCWGVVNNNKGTNSNRIVLFTKEEV